MSATVLLNPTNAVPVPRRYCSFAIVNGNVFIPPEVIDHASFRRWARSLETPRRIRLAYFNDTVWVDNVMEELFSHNRVKQAFNLDLGAFIKKSGTGTYLPEGMLLSHIPSGLSVEPDAIYLSYDAIESKRVVGQGADSRMVELIGSPEMVLEVVSDSSVKKDTATLPELYYSAGITEYWLVDTRGSTIKFRIFQRGEAAYVATAADAEGWMRSPLFDKEFRLTSGTDRLGKPTFDLEIR